MGNTRDKLVHDLLHEDPGPKGCKVFEAVQEGLAVRFEPDRLRAAREEGFQPCPRCFYRLEARRTYFTKALLEEAGEQDVD